MKDERIQTTLNRFAAMGLLICWYLLLPISLLYRMLILKLPPRDWWDIFAIWVIGILFVFIAFASRGVFANGFKKFFLAICIGVIIGVFTFAFITSQIHSVADMSEWLIGSSAGVGLVIGIAHFLNRRWKRKEGIEDD